MRETEISFVETHGGNYFLICSLPARNDTQIISIERYAGRLTYEGIFGKDLFFSSRDALQKIAGDQKCVKNCTKMKAIIGYFVLGAHAFLLAVTNNRLDLTLPKEHKIYSVTETRWFKIPLGYPNTISIEEQKKIEKFMKLDLNNNFFYCDTGLDLTKPFPYCYPNISTTDKPGMINLEHVSEFCWNDYLSFEFKIIGMRNWCCFLLQGFAKPKQLSIVSDSTNSPQTPTSTEISNSNFFNLAIICRKSWLNPIQNDLMGGLNSFGSPPNEFEFEQIVWRDSLISGICTWCSHFWRSGGVPVHWRIDKSNSASSPRPVDTKSSNFNTTNEMGSVTVAKKPFKECNQYFDRLAGRFSDFFDEKKPRITIVDSLKDNDPYGEGQLKEVFNSSLQTLKIQDPSIEERMEIEKIDFCWEVNPASGIASTDFHIFAAKVSSAQKLNGFSSGMLKFGKKDLSAQNSQPPVAELKTLTKQTGFFRFSCLDGLERSFFSGFCLALNVFYEQCRSLGVGLKNESQQETSNDAFADSWSSFEIPFESLKKIVKPSLTKGFAELFFAIITQFCSFNSNYSNNNKFGAQKPNTTNSSPIVQFMKDLAGFGSLPPTLLNNFNLDINYHNYMMLGLNWDQFFPTANEMNNSKENAKDNDPHHLFKMKSNHLMLEDLKKGIAQDLRNEKLVFLSKDGFILDMPPLSPKVSINHHTDTPEKLLLGTFSNENTGWMLPNGVYSTALEIFLPFFCKVAEISINIRNLILPEDENDNTNDKKKQIENRELSPTKIQVFFGTYADKIEEFGLEEFLPKVRNDGTKFLFDISTKFLERTSKGSVNCSSRTRFVKIVFSGQAIPFLYLGSVQLFGFVEKSSFSNSRRYWMEILPKICFNLTANSLQLSESSIYSEKEPKKLERELLTFLDNLLEKELENLKTFEIFDSSELENFEIFTKEFNFPTKDVYSSKKLEALFWFFTQKLRHEKFDLNDALFLECLKRKLQFSKEEQSTWDKLLSEFKIPFHILDPSSYFFKRDPKTEKEIRKQTRLMAKKCSNCKKSIKTCCENKNKKCCYVCSYCKQQFCKNCFPYSFVDIPRIEKLKEEKEKTIQNLKTSKVAYLDTRHEYEVEIPEEEYVPPKFVNYEDDEIEEEEQFDEFEDSEDENSEDSTAKQEAPKIENEKPIIIISNMQNEVILNQLGELDNSPAFTISEKYDQSTASNESSFRTNKSSEEIDDEAPLSCVTATNESFFDGNDQSEANDEPQAIMNIEDIKLSETIFFRKILEFCWKKPQPVCSACSKRIEEQILLLRLLKQFSSSTTKEDDLIKQETPKKLKFDFSEWMNSSLSHSICNNTGLKTEMIEVVFPETFSFSKMKTYVVENKSQKTNNTFYWLSPFPECALLNDLESETHSKSPPIETILLPFFDSNSLSKLRFYTNKEPASSCFGGTIMDDRTEFEITQQALEIFQFEQIFKEIELSNSQIDKQIELKASIFEKINRKFWFSKKIEENLDEKNQKHQISFTLVLPLFAKVHRIYMIVDKLGYSEFDLPTITVSLACRKSKFLTPIPWKLTTIQPQPNTNDLIVQPFSLQEFTIPRVYPQQNVRFVKFDVSFPNSSNKSRFFHFGRIFVFGQNSSSSSVMAPNSVSPSSVYSLDGSIEYKTKFEDLVQGFTKNSEITPIFRTFFNSQHEFYDKTSNSVCIWLVKPEDAHKSSKIPNSPFFSIAPSFQKLEETDQNQTSLCLPDNIIVSGFSFRASHGVEGVSSQAKLIRVILLCQASSNQNNTCFYSVVEDEPLFKVPKVAADTVLLFDFSRVFKNVSAIQFQILENHGAKETKIPKMRIYFKNLKIKGLE